MNPYLFGTVARLRVPPGRIVVHNNVTPSRILGRNGFRAYLADPGPQYVKCPCGWAPELGEHYIGAGLAKVRGVS